MSSNSKINKYLETFKRIYFSGKYQYGNGKKILNRKAKILGLDYEECNKLENNLLHKYEEFLGFMKDIYDYKEFTQEDIIEINEFQKDLEIDEYEAENLKKMFSDRVNNAQYNKGVSIVERFSEKINLKIYDVNCSDILDFDKSYEEIKMLTNISERETLLCEIKELYKKTIKINEIRSKMLDCIDKRKLNKFIENFDRKTHISINFAEIIAFYDDSIFYNGTKGFAISFQGIYVNMDGISGFFPFACMISQPNYKKALNSRIALFNREGKVELYCSGDKMPKIIFEVVKFLYDYNQRVNDNMF